MVLPGEILGELLEKNYVFRQADKDWIQVHRGVFSGCFLLTVPEPQYPEGAAHLSPRRAAETLRIGLKSMSVP